MNKENDFFNFDEIEAKDFLQENIENFEKNNYNNQSSQNYNEYEQEYDNSIESSRSYNQNNCGKDYGEYGENYDNCLNKYNNCKDDYHNGDCNPCSDYKEFKQKDRKCGQKQSDCEKPHNNCENPYEDKCNYNCYNNYRNDCCSPCEKEDDCYKAAKLQLVKSVDKKVATKGDVLRYCVIIKNIGNTDACNVVFKDCLSKGLRYIPGSLEVNGRNVGCCRNLEELLLGTICEGKEIKISFSAKIVGECEDVTNYAVACYCYIQHRCYAPINAKAISNEVRTAILQPRVVIEKCVNKEEVQVGEELNYKITVKNCGNCIAENFILRDILDCNLECLGVSGKCLSCEDLKEGINLGNIPPCEECEVFIRARVICPPANCIILNKATGCYKVNGIEIEAEPSNIVKTICTLNLCRTEFFEGVINLSCNKGPVKEICNKHSEARLLNVQLVKVVGDTKVYRLQIATRICFEYFKECRQCDSVVKDCIVERELCLPACYNYGQNFIICVEPECLEAKVKCGYDIYYKLGVEICLRNKCC